MYTDRPTALMSTRNQQPEQCRRNSHRTCWERPVRTRLYRSTSRRAQPVQRENGAAEPAKSTCRDAPWPPAPRSPGTRRNTGTWKVAGGRAKTDYKDGPGESPQHPRLLGGKRRCFYKKLQQDEGTASGTRRRDRRSTGGKGLHGGSSEGTRAQLLSNG